MNYAEIKRCDIANGPGVRTSLFVSGCRHRCPFCFNEVAWSFTAGKPFSDATMQELLDSLAPSYIRGITLLGGEPLEPENQPDLLKLVQSVRKQYTDKNVWLYTGFTWEELHDSSCRAAIDVLDELLSLVDVMVDGRFVQDLKDITLRFRGSSNQRIIDVVKSRAAGDIVLWQDIELYARHSM